MSGKIAVASSVAAGLLALALSGCSMKAGTGQETMGEGQMEAVWVCHGKKDPEWKKVPAPAADAHRKHGDEVSAAPKPEGASCGDGYRSR